MAEADFYDSSPFLESESVSPTSNRPQMKTASGTFSCSFLCRGLFVAILIALLPLLPTQAPEFFHQAILTTTWDLLHLLFVGIAISYGLFSQRSIEPVKEAQPKIDAPAQTYVSRILDISSFFEDEMESHLGLEESKLQNWNSQHFRGEPRATIAKGSPVFGDRSEVSLSLPIRSLKSRVSDPGESDSVDGAEVFADLGDGSDPGVEVSSSNHHHHHHQRNGSGEDREIRDRLVLPSPIPWRSRSVRMKSNRETVPAAPRSRSFPRYAEPRESDPLESHSPHSSPIPGSSRPHPSPEIRGKSGEDLGKMGVYKRPPPPLPSPMVEEKRSIPSEGVVLASSRDTVGSFKNETKKSSSSGEDFVTINDLDSDKMRSETTRKPRPEGPPVGRSVRTYRGREFAMQSSCSRKSNQAIASAGASSNQMSTATEKHPRSAQLSPKDSRKKEFTENIFGGYEDLEGDRKEEISDGVASFTAASVAGSEPDANEVDKKADEFIAKFREQIRLQRIELIKKSAEKRSGGGNPRPL